MKEGTWQKEFKVEKDRWRERRGKLEKIMSRKNVG